ncbi:MAG TPA: PAS domain-containing protein, partial [Thalassobaculum sp.]
MAVNTISWKTVERWTQGLIDQECREIRAAFVGDGVTAPQVVWSPTEEGLPTPMMRHVHRYWTELRGSEVAPHHREIDPFGFVPALGYANILETVEGSLDLRYRLFGSLAARISGFDMTGRLLSEHPASRYVAEFALASSNA